MTRTPAPGPIEETAGGGPRRRRFRGLWAILAGSLVVLYVLTRVLDIDVTGTDHVPDPSTPASPTAEADCESGEQSLQCRTLTTFASLDEFWSAQADQLGLTHAPPGVTWFSGATDQCASAPGVSGPFYCPLDQVIYLDTDFFAALETAADSSPEEGEFIESYVLAHEWAHHVQNLSGLHDQIAASERETPARENLRLELQADCLVGAWADPASVEEVTAAIDATIRAEQATTASTGPGDPGLGGSREQRQSWFDEGSNGGVAACDTFAVPADDL